MSLLVEVTRQNFFRKLRNCHSLTIFPVLVKLTHLCQRKHILGRKWPFSNLIITYFGREQKFWYPHSLVKSHFFAKRLTENWPIMRGWGGGACQVSLGTCLMIVYQFQKVQIKNTQLSCPLFFRQCLFCNQERITTVKMS